MEGRSALVVVLVGALIPAAAAQAAQRPRNQSRVCHLVTDPWNDATGGPLGNPTGTEMAYDVTSADIATDQRTITAAVRVAGLAKSTSSSPTGLHWRLDFTVLGSSTPLFLQAFSTPFGDNFDMGWVDGGTSNSYSGARVTGVFDFERNEVRVSAPITTPKDDANLSPGAVIESLKASAGRFYNTAGTHPSVSERTDVAESGRTYTAGTPSCVPVGR